METPSSDTEKAVAEDSQQDSQWAEGLDEEDLNELRQARDDDTKIVLESPVRLGYYSLLCLIMNRMIGMIYQRFKRNAPEVLELLTWDQEPESLTRLPWSFQIPRA